jgi:hypothetical protein
MHNKQNKNDIFFLIFQEIDSDEALTVQKERLTKQSIEKMLTSFSAYRKSPY